MAIVIPDNPLIGKVELLPSYTTEVCDATELIIGEEPNLKSSFNLQKCSNKASVIKRSKCLCGENDMTYRWCEEHFNKYIKRCEEALSNLQKKN